MRRAHGLLRSAAAGFFAGCSTYPNPLLVLIPHTPGSLVRLTTNNTQLPHQLTRTITIHLPRQVSLGKFHSCALKSSGKAMCWGKNYYGQTDVPPSLEVRAARAPLAVSLRARPPPTPLTLPARGGASGSSSCKLPLAKSTRAGSPRPGVLCAGARTRTASATRLRATSLCRCLAAPATHAASRLVTRLCAGALTFRGSQIRQPRCMSGGSCRYARPPRLSSGRGGERLE